MDNVTNTGVLNTETTEKSTESANLNTNNAEINATPVETGAAPAAAETSQTVETVVLSKEEQLKADIAKIENHIDGLKSDGEELYADAIGVLEAKRDELVAQVEELASETKNDVEEAATEVVTVEKSLVQKYGQAVAHGVEIVLLGIIAGKLLGVL